jgi:two-component system, LytTR family, sensor kinase
MNKRQLYKTALFSSPIIAAFELSPIFFLYKEPILHFFAAAAGLTLITFVLWSLNINMLSAFESRRKAKQSKRYLCSYFSALFIILVFLFLSTFFSPPKEETPSILFPFINAVALNTIILIIINSIVNRSKKEQSERELALLKIKNLEAEQQQLIQQLQPHFLFNALSTLKSLISYDTELAEEYLVKLSDFLRYTISSHASTLVSLEEEMKFTNDYIKLQQIRFGNSIFCKTDVPETARQSFLLPAYALQALVENALKHNAFTIGKPLNLSITYKDAGIEVRNNKIPRLNENKTGVGLENLDKRYSLIGGEGIMVDDNTDYFFVRIKLIPKK